MLLNQIEAAMKLGISFELLEYFTKHCPKKDETRLLQTKAVDGNVFFDDQELIAYQKYLNLPWHFTKGKRPPIPEAIKDDIKSESHLGCAICGYADNGEVAHIVAVADSLNNSPDNLIYLCPNHHTKYDLGFKPASNVTLKVIQAAKDLKRNTRQRMMRHEANATKLCLALTTMLKSLKRDFEKGTHTGQMAEVYLTETISLMERLPQLAAEAQEAARADRDIGDTGQLVGKIAPKLMRLSAGVNSNTKESQLRTAVSSVVDAVDHVLLDLDEVECPRCDGRGLTGLVGDLCAYCHGDCFVSTDEAADYDPEAIDQADCPRCEGRGMIGLAGSYCPFCRGSCLVSAERAAEYDEYDLPDKQYPHCQGSGVRGLVSDYCPYCRGDTIVSADKFDAYDLDNIDEAECPHCGGAGVTGLCHDFCAYCRGSQFVTKDKRKKYKSSQIDEVECPPLRGPGCPGAR